MAVAARADGLAAATATFADAQAQTRDVIAGNVLAQVTRLWQRYVVDNRAPVGADRDRFAAQVLQTVQAGQRQTAQTTASYMQALIEQTPDATSIGRTVVQLPETLRNTDDPAAPYLRPLAQLAAERGRRGRQVKPAVAADRAYRRLMVMVDTDLTMAMREGARQATADNPDVIGTRRIVRPELSRGGVCGLCLAAADRIYSKRLLMPIHARCNCEPVIVTRNHDPGVELNEQDFRQIYQPSDAGPSTDTSAEALKRVRFVVSEHGEMGAVLRRAEDNFTGPGDLSRIQLSRAVEQPEPATVTPIRKPRGVRDLSDDELSDAMQAALADEDFDRFDELALEEERRDEQRTRRREQAAARSARRDEERALEMERLLAAGVDEESAVEAAYGIPVERQRRDRAMATLRNNGYVGARFDELARQSFRDYVYQQYLAAEDATNGYMLNREGEGKGIDPYSLFVGNEARARRYASDELLEWWDQNGRPTLEEWKAELLGDTAGAGRVRSARGDFLR